VAVLGDDGKDVGLFAVELRRVDDIMQPARSNIPTPQHLNIMASQYPDM
jgi:hypothetical protein